MPSDAVVGPTSDMATLTAGKIYEITTLPINETELAAYKAVLLGAGNTTLQLDSEIVVGSTFEVTSAEDLKLITLGYGAAAATGLDNTANVATDKTYIVTALPVVDDADDDVDQLSYVVDHSDTTSPDVARNILLKTSNIFRGNDSDGTAVTTGDMAVGDVLVVNSEITLSLIHI